MELLKETRFIERFQFFNGQRLFASDLQGIEQFNREMRWLHNRSLHQPGIGNGFAVSGKKGDREVTIGPGYAIDAEGREIVLTQDQIEPIPPVAGEDDGRPFLFDLTISYPGDEDLEESETRDGICLPRGVIRLKEEPVFCWVRLNEDGQPISAAQKKAILGGMMIVLARAEVLNCQLNSNISTAQRISARPATQPYVCCGHDEPKWDPLILAPFDVASVLGHSTGATLFQSFAAALTFFPAILPIGITAVVDTSDCGFVTTPCYSARIAGPRIRTLNLPDTAVSTRLASAGLSQISFALDGIVQITDPQPNQFTVSVLLLGQMLLGSANAQELTLLAQMVMAFLTNLDTTSSGFQKQLSELVSRLFDYSSDETTGNESGWSLVWMGVED